VTRRILARFGLQALSIALAVILWFLVAGQQQAERSLRVALEFQNIPESLEMTGEPPSAVDVRVRGAAGTVAQLRSGDLIVLVDLRSARAGKRLFHLTPAEVTVPHGVTVLHVLPSTVSLQFETSVSKRVPVVPSVEGTPAPGFVIGPVVASPASVDVIGPASIVQQLSQATTEPVSVNGARARVRDNVTIGLPESMARLRLPRDAVVTVEILPAPVERLVSDVPVTVRGTGRGLRARVSPRQVAVTVSGPGNLVRQLSAQSIPAFVDITGLTRGQYTLAVRFDPTTNYSALAAQPASVRVTIP